MAGQPLPATLEEAHAEILRLLEDRDRWERFARLCERIALNLADTVSTHGIEAIQALHRIRGSHRIPGRPPEVLKKAITPPAPVQP